MNVGEKGQKGKGKKAPKKLKKKRRDRGRKKDPREEKKDNRARESMTEVSAGGLFDQGRAVVIWVSPVSLYGSVISADSSKWIPEHLSSSQYSNRLISLDRALIQTRPT